MTKTRKLGITIAKAQNPLLFGFFVLLYVCAIGTFVMIVDTECQYFTNKHLLKTFMKIQALQLRNQLQMESLDSTPTPYVNNMSPPKNDSKERSKKIESKKRIKSDFKKTKRKMIENTLSKHIDYLQVNLLRDRLRVRGMSANETISIHSNHRNQPPEHKARTHVSAHRLFDTCAIVGNSDALLQSKCGAEIDAHDYVMRSNMAPTHGFTDDVGNRTDFMVVHQTRFLDIARCIQNKYSSCHESAKRELSDLGDANMWIVKHGGINPKSFDQISMFARYNDIDLVLSYPNLKYLRTTISSFWGFNIDGSSNGIFLFTVAVPLCKKISLYGFEISHKKSNTKMTNNPYFMDTPLQEFNRKYIMKRELKQLESLNATHTLRLVSLPCWL